MLSPATQDSALSTQDLLLVTPDGAAYYDGRQSLKVSQPDSTIIDWPLPQNAIGSGKPTLLRTRDNLLFLFNEPGRIVRIRLHRHTLGIGINREFIHRQRRLPRVHRRTKLRIQQTLILPHRRARLRSIVSTAVVVFAILGFGCLTAEAATFTVPNLLFAKAPHSPFATGLRRSQSGTKFPRRGSPAGNSESFHVRSVVVTIAFAGLATAAIVVDSRLTYRPNDTFSAVLPFPKTS